MSLLNNLLSNIKDHFRQLPTVLSFYDGDINKALSDCPGASGYNKSTYDLYFNNSKIGDTCLEYSLDVDYNINLFSFYSYVNPEIVLKQHLGGKIDLDPDISIILNDNNRDKIKDIAVPLEVPVELREYFEQGGLIFNSDNQPNITTNKYYIGTVPIKIVLLERGLAIHTKKWYLYPKERTLNRVFCLLFHTKYSEIQLSTNDIINHENTIKNDLINLNKLKDIKENRIFLSDFININFDSIMKSCKDLQFRLNTITTSDQKYLFSSSEIELINKTIKTLKKPRL
jgi:hypothetical protein